MSNFAFFNILHELVDVKIIREGGTEEGGDSEHLGLRGCITSVGAAATVDTSTTTTTTCT